MTEEINVRETLGVLWKEALELDDVPKDDDNFFNLGGNSYKAFSLWKISRRSIRIR